MSLFLHQTTTFSDDDNDFDRCICLYSYIKPQQWWCIYTFPFCCICLYSYIKPQLLTCAYYHPSVVYVSIPTSNHNLRSKSLTISKLYMSLFLHQTTTIVYEVWVLSGCICLYSYIKPQPVLRLPFAPLGCICLYSYIKPQRNPKRLSDIPSCICLYSYIKPQRRGFVRALKTVVYVSIPTSNHNQMVEQQIKDIVVYVSIPTSNHNLGRGFVRALKVVYVSIPTSNHNYTLLWDYTFLVVYVSIPTSNHNFS